ncbi:MAG: glycogen/starch synthase [Erysipelotrichaceae bacterium]|nr:glycogen/starch synthase [Erysipelotrichaceae bacterium]
MKKIMFVGSESYPFAKTGGLGDVMYALPRALNKEGCDARVIMPLYGCIKDQYKEKMEYITHFYMQVGNNGKEWYVGIKKYDLDGVTYYFIDNEELFGWGNPYSDMSDDLEKFIYFDKAVLAALPVIGFIPDVIHCNDWQAGLVPVYLRTLFANTEVGQTSKVIMTIHNLRFQGIHTIQRIQYLSGLPDYVFTYDKLTQHGDANMLKGGMIFSDRITTVSNSYAEEIKTAEYGENLEGVTSYHAYKLLGIVNGIDYDIYNPATDGKLFANYDSETFKAGKAANKAALQEELGLEVNPNKMMIGLISRLTDQKGLDLLLPIIDQIIDGNTQFVLLGTGVPEYENGFRYFENRHRGNVSASIMYSDERSRKIYAAADAMLVPSRFEPCGLTQLMAMRYGSVPIVRETGGLKDTVEAYNKFEGTGTGFSFEEYYPWILLDCINKAKELYFTAPEAWDALVQRDMEQDFSWDKAAKQYLEMYESL